MKKNDRISFEQCKHWKKQKVGVKEVGELNGVVSAKGIYSGILVASGIFTTSAIEFAESSGIELVDGKELIKLTPQIEDPIPSTAYTKVTPSCHKVWGYNGKANCQETSFGDALLFRSVKDCGYLIGC